MKDELFTLQYHLKRNTTDVRNMKTSITDATSKLISLEDEFPVVKSVTKDLQAALPQMVNEQLENEGVIEKIVSAIRKRGCDDDDEEATRSARPSKHRRVSPRNKQLEVGSLVSALR